MEPDDKRFFDLMKQSMDIFTTMMCFKDMTALYPEESDAP